MNEIHPSPVPSPKGRGERKGRSPFPLGKGVRGIGLLAIFILHSSFFNSLAWAAPTLARLSFYVPPNRMTQFEVAYRGKVVPILKRHGLVESSERGRVTPDSVFSRLFEVKTPSKVGRMREALEGDTTWTAALRVLGRAFRTARSDSLVRYSFTLYSAPAGSGRAVTAGPGKKVPAGHGKGHWRTYDMTDGLAGANVFSILQDREGYLWFGTNNGVSRYDGQIWTTFNAHDGLPPHRVRTIFQDREGVFWFGTEGGGVSRYDGKNWTTYTTQDGLAGDRVRAIFQDQEGYLWFGTEGLYYGLTRYNPSADSGSAGQKFLTFNLKDGLRRGGVQAIFQDREGYLWFSHWTNGVSRYDPLRQSSGQALRLAGARSGQASAGPGKRFTFFTTAEGLAENRVQA